MLQAAFSGANGFPNPVYMPMLQQLQYVDLYLLAPLAENAPVQQGWSNLAEDLYRQVLRLDRPRIVIGHSLGAYAAYLAACRHPGFADGLLLLEPPMFHWAKGMAIRVLNQLGLLDRFPPAALAKRRRRHFQDATHARAYFETKPFFQRLHPSCFDAYLEHGLVAAGQAPAGENLTLRFSAEREYAVFTTAPTRIPAMHRAPGWCHWATGADTQTLSKADRRWTRSNLPAFQAHVWPGGHLFPLEQPQATAMHIQALVDRFAF